MYLQKSVALLQSYRDFISKPEIPKRWDFFQRQGPYNKSGTLFRSQVILRNFILDSRIQTLEREFIHAHGLLFLKPGLCNRSLDEDTWCVPFNVYFIPWDFRTLPLDVFAALCFLQTLEFDTAPS